VKVYFKNDRTVQQINTIGRRFDPKVNPLVQKLTFVPKEEALKIMQKRLPQLNKGLAYNPYPDAYEIRPTKGEYINDIRAQLRPIPAGVDRINDGGTTSHRVLKVGGIISVVCLIGVLLLLIASTLLIANTIRLSIFARRREIEVMKLVGSIAAVVLLVIGKSVVLPSIGLGHSKDAHALAFELNALILIGIGLALGVSGTGLTLRRFLQV
jgi:cell division transport system permease protein